MNATPSWTGRVWRIFSWLAERAGLLAGGLTLVMMVAILREVAGRYFFNHPSNWSLELCGYLLVAMTYLGAPYTEFVEGNIRIDFLYSRFRNRTKHLVDAIICLVGLVWTGMLIGQGCRLAFHSLKIGARSSEAMAWPLFPSQVLVPVGSVFLALVFLGKFMVAIAGLAGRQGE